MGGLGFFFVGFCFGFCFVLFCGFWVLKDCDPVSDLLIITNFFAESRYKRY